MIYGQVLLLRCIELGSERAAECEEHYHSGLRVAVRLCVELSHWLQHS